MTTEFAKDWRELPIALGWLALSIALMIILDSSDSVVSALHPLTSTVLSDAGVFSGWNRIPPFDSPAGRALTTIFILLAPVQIASFFAIPDEAICPRAQVKGVPAFLTIMLVLALVPLLTFWWGLSVNGPLRIFGKETLLGVAATICVVTLAFSYLVRMIPILPRVVLQAGDSG